MEQPGRQTATDPTTRPDAPAAPADRLRRATPALVGVAAALVATSLWGFTFLGPVAVAPVNIYYLVLGRYTVFGLMSAAVLAGRPDRLRALGARNVAKALHLGVVGYVGFYLLLSMSASVGGGVLASTMTGLIPVMVALASNAIEKVFRWRLCLIPIVVISVGLFLVNGGGHAFGSDTSGRTRLTGAALGFAACLAWSYFVIANRITMKQVGSALHNSTWTACIGLGAFGSSLVLLPLAQSAGGRSPFASGHALWPFVAWCVALALLGSWCATWFWNIASGRLPSTVMAPIIGMEAVFGAFFNLLWLRRMPTAAEFWGGVLVIGGVFLSVHIFDRARLPEASGS
ncbi:DMT family transporter [Streptomyces odontomachi]|uniref:DMT family transporter n=1 Tax=Streptomyces odontomachi TaxID=2944940 RepID=UPI00210E7C36|nr:DMT family transporter [Streptomyces sp. ODS25]